MERILATSRLLAGTLLLALAGCAPPSAFRAVNVSMDAPAEAGGGVTYVGPAEGGLGCAESFAGCEGFVVQGWGQYRVGRWATVGATAFAGEPTVGLGGSLRLHWVDARRVQFGTDLDAGSTWFGLALPVAVGLRDDLWIATAPGVRFATHQLVRAPLAVAWSPAPGAWVQAEGSVGLGSQYEGADPTWTVGLAGARRW